jgi:hypothetical protein
MPNSHDNRAYQEMLRTAAGARAANDGEADPEAVDLGPCAGRPDRWLAGIHIKSRQGAARSFQYGHLGHQEYHASNTGFILEFHQPEKWRVTVRGRNLWTIYDNIVQHRLPWIREADQDFAADKEAIITAIAIEPVEEKEAALSLSALVDFLRSFPVGNAAKDRAG